jgi:peptide/nickel transport system substrate-binding protein
MLRTSRPSPRVTPRPGLPVLLGAVATILLLVGPSSTVAAEAKRGGTLVIALGGDLPTINPAVSSDITQLAVAAQVYNTLVRLDNEGRLHGVLAETWQVSPDGKTYTFQLRKDVKWHDGTPFTSADVAHTFMKISREYSGFGSTTFTIVSSMDTPDPHRVVLRLEHSYPPLLMSLADLVVGVVLPKHIYDGSDPRKNPRNFDPVGTGPFRFEEYKKGSHVTLTANPGYFEGRPPLDRLVFQILPNRAARALSLERGDVDYIPYFAMPLAELERLERNPVVTIKNAERPSAAIFMAFFNTRVAPFDKKEVRQAIYHALDRQDMVKKAAFGHGTVSGGPISSLQRRFYTGAGRPYPHDPTRARQLLDAAGLPARDGGVRFKMRVSYDKAESALDAAAQLMRSQLKDVGVDVQVQPLDAATWRDTAWIKWDFDLTMGSFSTGPDPTVGIERLYVCRNIQPLFARNVSGYCNPRLDRVFEQAAEENDHEKRRALFAEVARILGEDVPALMLWDRHYPFAHKKTVVGLPVDPTQWQGFVRVGFQE